MYKYFKMRKKNFHYYPNRKKSFTNGGLVRNSLKMLEIHYKNVVKGPYTLLELAVFFYNSLPCGRNNQKRAMSTEHRLDIMLVRIS